METRDWGDNDIDDGASGPVGLEFFGRSHSDPDTSANTNRIEDPGFAYDLSGNLTRLIAADDGASGALWDSRNRMSAYFQGNPEQQGRPAERYLYDAEGYRIVRFPEADDGRPVISLRDGSGQLLAEFAPASAGSGTKLRKDFVYGTGQLLVERRVTENTVTLSSAPVLESGGQYGFAPTAEAAYASYTVDVRTRSGIVSQTSGVIPDAQGLLWLEESAPALNDTNFIRARGESDQAEPYSAPATLSPQVNVNRGVRGQDKSSVPSGSTEGLCIGTTFFLLGRRAPEPRSQDHDHEKTASSDDLLASLAHRMQRAGTRFSAQSCR